ncbi:MAG: type II toxin-antitoxin system HicB family antitoxin [Candidatus Paceibacterales bacterium]
MKIFRFNLVFQAEPEGGFTVLVPALPGCVSYGKNLKQAKSMASDAVAGYLRSLKKHGKPIPNDDNSFISMTEIAVAGDKIKKVSYA